MFGYYLDLAWRSLRRHWIMTVLMVLAIGLGIGASMTMITVIHVMSGNPLPGRSAKLYVPMLDPRPAHPGQTSRDTPDGFTWVDAMNLLRAGKADRQAAMDAGTAAVQPTKTGLHPFFVRGHYVTSDFFSMFGVPFAAGGGWSSTADKEQARVIVLDSGLAEKLFGKTRALGQTVRINHEDFRVVGVADHWRPQPLFYAQKGGRIFGTADQFFLPLRTAMALHFHFSDHFSCWDSRGDKRKSDHCTWLQFWVELDTPAKARAYQRFLASYQADQHASGRFPRQRTPALFRLMDWLAHERIIPSNLSMQMWLAVGFLVVAMLCVMALLLAKFLRRSGEISIRRALGAGRRDVFMQLGIEAALLGVAGGVLGLVVAQAGLWSVRHRSGGFAHLAHMDASMLAATVALAIMASVLAGLIPAWRACQVPPALQLKAQ